MPFGRLRRLLQQLANKKNPPKPSYIGDELCNTQMKNGVYDTSQCFLDKPLKATDFTLNDENSKVMKKVLGYNKEPVTNQHQCSLIAKYGDHCEGKNIYNADEKACPLYLYKEEDMYDGKTIENYIITKINSIDTNNKKDTEGKEAEKQLGKLICEIGTTNFEKYKKYFEEFSLNITKNEKLSKELLSKTIATCKATDIKKSERNGECWVANDEIYSKLMQNILNPDKTANNDNQDTLHLTNLLDAEKNYKSFSETGDKLGNIFNTILDNEKYKNENMKYFQPTILQGVIQSSLSGEDIEIVIKKYQTEMRLKTDEEKEKIKKLILEYQTAIQKLSKNDKTIKKVIEKFSTADTLARKVHFNYEKLQMKDTFISVLYYILILCILFIVFVMASAVGKGTTTRNVMNNINANIQNLLET
jgi:hypothetical protein